MHWLRLNPAAPVLAVLAVLIRLHASGGFKGLTNVLGNDPGIYFSAGAALIHGRMPYSDFTLVHPPGVAVFMAPFAWIGSLTSDVHGFALARLVMMLFGLVNAFLIYLVAAKIGRIAAISAALVYCLLPGVIWVERTVYLEAPMLLATLVGLLIFNSAAPPSKRRLIIAGILFGIAISFKLWAVIPCLFLIIAVAVLRNAKAALIYLLATAATAIVIMLPFFIAAPSQMFNLILVDQLGRSGQARGLARIPYMLSLTHGLHQSAAVKYSIIALALLVIAMIIAWIYEPRARLWVTLCAVQLLVVLSVPTFFGAYRAFYAVGMCLVIATIGQLCWNLMRRNSETPAAAMYRVMAGGAAAVFVVGCYWLFTHADKPGFKVPVGTLSTAVKPGHCVTASNPSWMTASNSLTRSLDNGCPLIVDLAGNKFGLSKKAYQALRTSYLSSGDYVFTTPAESTNPAISTNRPLLYAKRSIVLLGPN